MDTIVRQFASRLHYLRTERDMTQETLASNAGLHPAYVSAMECGRQIPTLVTVEKLASGLGMPVASLIDYPMPGRAKKRSKERHQDEIQLVVRLLERCDLAKLKRIRKAVEALVEA